MPFLPANQQRQSTESSVKQSKTKFEIANCNQAVTLLQAQKQHLQLGLELSFSCFIVCDGQQLRISDNSQSSINMSLSTCY